MSELLLIPCLNNCIPDISPQIIDGNDKKLCIQRGKLRSKLPIGSMLFMDFPPYLADPSEKQFNISQIFTFVLCLCDLIEAYYGYIIMFPMHMRAFEDSESFLNAKLIDKKC